jgi:hypothetical protein
MDSTLILNYSLTTNRVDVNGIYMTVYRLFTWAISRYGAEIGVHCRCFKCSHMKCCFKIKC